MNKHFSIKILFFLILLISNIFFSQNNNIEYLNYVKIEKKIDSLYDINHNEGIKLVKFYIKKSKKDKNNEALFYAYRYASKIFSSPQNFQYADSALSTSKISNNKNLITDAYLNKGVVLMDASLYKLALDNILTANKYSLDLKNPYITNKTKYFIAQNKIYLGLYEDANEELLQCISYFRENVNKSSLGEDNEKYYLYSLMSILDTHTKIGKHSQNKPFLNDNVKPSR